MFISLLDTRNTETGDWEVPKSLAIRRVAPRVCTESSSSSSNSLEWIMSITTSRSGSIWIWWRRILLPPEHPQILDSHSSKLVQSKEFLSEANQWEFPSQSWNKVASQTGQQLGRGVWRTQDSIVPSNKDYSKKHAGSKKDHLLLIYIEGEWDRRRCWKPSSKHPCLHFKSMMVLTLFTNLDNNIS